MVDFDEDASPSKYPEVYNEDEDSMSPEIRSKTHIVVENKEMKNLEIKVREHIRRNSVKPVNV